jgi:hypothetical protein
MSKSRVVRYVLSSLMLASVGCAIESTDDAREDENVLPDELNESDAPADPRTSFKDAGAGKPRGPVDWDEEPWPSEEEASHELPDCEQEGESAQLCSVMTLVSEGCVDLVDITIQAKRFCGLVGLEVGALKLGESDSCAGGASEAWASCCPAKPSKPIKPPPALRDAGITKPDASFATKDAGRGWSDAGADVPPPPNDPFYPRPDPRCTEHVIGDGKLCIDPQVLTERAMDDCESRGLYMPTLVAPQTDCPPASFSQAKYLCCPDPG